MTPASTTPSAVNASSSGMNGRPSAPRNLASAISQPIREASSNASAALEPLNIGPRPPAIIETMQAMPAVAAPRRKPMAAWSGASAAKAISP